MDEILTEDLNGRRTGKFWVAIALVLFSILTSLGRVYTRNEPLDCDIATYAVIAHEMLCGQRLYTDVWDHKPPAIYMVYAAAEMVAGYGPGSVLLLNIAASLITLTGVYRAASLGKMGRGSGLWAAALWSIVSLNLPLQANQPNSEVFINACMIWVFVVFLGAEERPIGHLKALWLGVLAAAATLFKHTIFLPFATLSIVYVIGTAQTKTLRAKRFVSVFVAFVVIVFCWLAAGGYFAAGGRFRDFYDAVFRYNISYIGNPLKSLWNSLGPKRIVFLFIAVLPSGLAIGAHFAGMLRRQVQPFILMIGFAIGTGLTVASTNKWFPHYFQLWLPGFCVLLGWSYVLLGDMFGNMRMRRFLPGIVVGVIVLPILVNQLLMYRLTPKEWATRKYGRCTADYVQQAEEINKILKPQEIFYHFGGEPGLYFAAKRRPPAGILLYYHLYRGPLSESLSKRVVSDLERSKPDMLVACKDIDMSWSPKRRKERPVAKWCEQNYRPLSGNEKLQCYYLFARKGSDLERRIFGEQTR